MPIDLIYQSKWGGGGQVSGGAMKMKAAVTDMRGGPFTVREVSLDRPRQDEILVKIAAVGICHTDIVAQHGGFGFDLPGVLGHEAAGVVEQVGGDVTSVAPGDRVALTFRSCGGCRKCESGHPAYCRDMPALNYAGRRPDGSNAISDADGPLLSNFFGQSSFATHALAYERNVVKIPDELPFELGAPLGCGIQTGAGAIINVFAAEPGSTLLVAGAGAVGLSAVMAAVIQDCAAVIVIEPNTARRGLALELGATHVIDPHAADDLAAAIKAIAPTGIDYAFDTSARHEILTVLIDVLAPHGTLGFVGVGSPETNLSINLAHAMTYGHTIRGIIEGDSDPSRFLPQLAAHVLAGRLPLERLVRCYPFEAINEAIADQHDGRCVKAVLIFD